MQSLVSILICSPSLIKIGTCTSKPDESFAGFKVFETVSPFKPGSVSETVFITNVGSSTFKTSPSQKSILHSSSPSNQSLIVSFWSAVISICS